MLAASVARLTPVVKTTSLNETSFTAMYQKGTRECGRGRERVGRQGGQGSVGEGGEKWDKGEVTNKSC
ncbi:hypothetical protein BV372_32090 [Nostoc sp. T09]|nr:hypothetical protein BV372_32090 [Nostoc sp. T09]